MKSQSVWNKIGKLFSYFYYYECQVSINMYADVIF